MDVYQVIMTTDVRDLVKPEDSFSRETDFGLFASLKLADCFIEKHSNDQLEAEMAVGNGAWISAYPKEDNFSYEEVPCERKLIMIEDRPNGCLNRFDYYVKRRIVKES